MLYIPVDFIVLRNAVYVALSIEDTGHLQQQVTRQPVSFDLVKLMRNNTIHFIATFSMLSLVVFIVLMLAYYDVSHGKSFDRLLNFTGSIAGGFLSFVYPAMIYMKIKGKTAGRYTEAQVLAAFGIFVMIVVPVSIFTYDDT